MHILKKYKGFTLVELVIVIVIVGILSVISVPIYRGYVQKAKMTEGQILVNGLVKAQLAYHTKHGYFYDCGGYVNSDKNIDMDARGNKYFTEFDCWVNGDSGDAPAGSWPPGRTHPASRPIHSPRGCRSARFPPAPGRKPRKRGCRSPGRRRPPGPSL